MRKLIRVRCRSLITVIVAAGLAGEIFATETTRSSDPATPASTSGSRLASTAGDPRPSSSTALLAERSSFVQANEFEGMRSAAEHGVPQAQFNLGLCYENGHGVAKDRAQAIHWFRKAADQGYDEAQYTLGCCYNGDDGFAKDPIEAAKWWRKAAAQGYADAQYCLGLSYSMGEGVPKNPAEAAKWWGKAAEQDHADAQYFLGLSYSAGLGVPKIPQQAVYWLRQAATHGSENARAALKKLGEDHEVPAKK